MVKKEIEINQELLPVLAYLAGPVEQVLSPWARFKETTEPTEAQWQKLQETGLVNTDKVLNTDIAETIDYLKTPTRFLRLRLQAGPMLLEHLIYSCKKAGASEKTLISFTAGQEKTIISNPAPLDMILVGLLEHLGDSSLTSSALKLKLSRESALVFAAIVDLQRRKALADIATMQSFKQPLFSKTEILEALTDTPANMQWLTAAISAFYNQKESLTSAELQAALDNLLEQEVVSLENDKYHLKGQALSFANHFLLINRILKLELGTLQSNTEAARSEMICLQAGNHDLLYLEQENEQLIIEAVSAHYIAEIIDTLLTKENEIPEEQAGHNFPAPPPPVKNTDLKPPLPLQPTASAGKTVYFINRDNNNYGPYTLNNLKDYAVSGNLSKTDLVWVAEKETWVKAETLGIFK